MRNGLPNNSNNNNRNRNRNRNNGSNNGGRPQGNNGYRPENRGNNDRVRGNANQLMEKYKNLARDSASAGDRVLAEYYMQHADHYFRVLAEFRSRYEENRPRDQRQDDQDNQDGNDSRNDDHAPEGVDMLDLAAAAGFGAAASVATFGADGPPSTDTSSQSAEVTDSPAADNGDQEESDVPTQNTVRRSRARGRPRKQDVDPIEA